MVCDTTEVKQSRLLAEMDAAVAMMERIIAENKAAATDQGEYQRYRNKLVIWYDSANEVLQLNNKDANKIFGHPDNLKLKSSMTLFEAAAPEYEVFKEVLEQYFRGERDEKTMHIIQFGAEEW